MDLTKYQSQVVYDVLGFNDFNYSLCLITSAVGNLARLCSDSLKEEPGASTDTVDEGKFIAPVGDMWYALTTFVSLLGIPIASLEVYAKIVDGKGRPYSYWLSKLVGVVGDLNDRMIEYANKNDSMLTVPEVRKLRRWEYGDNIRAMLADGCILIMHVLYRLEASLKLTTESVLDKDLRRRYHDECD